MKMGFYRFAFFTTLTLFANTAIAAGPRSIFDDDWTPPKASDTPRPTPPLTPAKPTPTPSDPTPSAKAPAPLRAVPAKAGQAAVRKVMKEVYAEQLVDRSVPARRKLAEALLLQADKSANAPVDQFVLLAAAIDAAVDAGDLPTAFKAADQMAEGFEVDSLAIKAETTAKVNPRAESPESALLNVDAGLELVAGLAVTDDYAAAARVCNALQSLSAGNIELRARVQQRQRELGLARELHERALRDMKKLQTSPDDPAANLAVGRYTCFVKGDWARGLAMLKKGSDTTLKTLAAQEIAGISTADAITHLADGWWDAAAKTVDVPSRTAMQIHAASLYSQVLKQIDGLRRVQIEKRIAEAEKATAALVTAVERKATTMIVYANKTPQSAGDVRKGQKLKITAKGAWTSNINDFGRTPCFGPDGYRVDGMPGHNDLCLLEAYIGKTVIVIGNEKTIEIPEDGTLRFGMHDSNGEAGTHDNAGQVTLTISQARQTAVAAGSARGGN
jgi:hypothetical protein